MDISTYISVAVSLVMALFTSWLLLLPFFSAKEASLGPSEESAENKGEIQFERILFSLEELEEDWLSGKLSEEEYTREKALLTTDAVQMKRSISQS